MPNFRNKNLDKKTTFHRVSVVLFFLLYLQPFMWFQTYKYLPNIGILSEIPNKNVVRIYSMGDPQFYFRFLALDLQNSGDSYGRFSALKDYDYKLLNKWFYLLDDLDSRSKYVPSLSAYYFSNTQNVEDVRYVIDYLEYYFDKNPKENWWWIAQATIMAHSRLKDKNLAIRLAHKLSNSGPDIPRWAQQMPAIISAHYGENQMAFEIMKDLADRYDDYSQSELNFMNYFIRNRLGLLKESIDKEPTKIDNDPLFMR